MEENQNSILTADVIKEIVSKEIASALEAKYEEKKAKAQKKFNLTGSEEDKAKLDAVKSTDASVKFFKALSNGDRKTLKDMHSQRAKALNEGTSSAGGYLVPVEFEKNVLMYLDDYSQIRSDCTVLPMGSNVRKLNSLTSSVTVYKTGEMTAGTASQPVFGEPVLTAIKRMAITEWSSELAEDEETSSLTILQQKIAEALAKDEQNDFVNGTTSGSEGLLQVSGVTAYSLGGTTTSGKTAFTNVTFDDIANLIAKLQEISLNDAKGIKLYMSPSVYNVLRISKASTSGEYFLPVAPSQDNAPMAWGYPIVILNEMPLTANTAVSTKFLVASNLKKHAFIGDRRGLTVKILTEGTVGSDNLAEQDMEAIRVTKRTAFTTALQNGIGVLKTSAS